VILLALLSWVLLSSDPADSPGPLPPSPGEEPVTGYVPYSYEEGTSGSVRAAEPSGPPGEAPRVGTAGWILVRVCEAGSSRPVVLAGVAVRSGEDRTGENMKKFQTTKDGTVWAGPLEPGTLHVNIAHGHFVDRSMTRFVSPATGPEDYPEITVEMTRAFRIAGRVVATDGMPVEGALHLTARPLNPSDAEVAPNSLRTDTNEGAFRFDPLPPGRYEITLYHRDLATYESQQAGRWQVKAGDEDLVLEYELHPVARPEPATPDPRARRTPRRGRRASPARSRARPGPPGCRRAGPGSSRRTRAGAPRGTRRAPRRTPWSRTR
jgi:hypothetical protein